MGASCVMRMIRIWFLQQGQHMWSNLKEELPLRPRHRMASQHHGITACGMRHAARGFSLLF